MVITDPIADLICRIKNALARKKSHVEVPSSKILQEIARLLKEEGYIANYAFKEDNKQGILSLALKYTEDGSSVIQGIKRISHLGSRKYVGVDRIPRVLEGLGRAIISTSRGLLTDKECRKNHLGGEVVLYVW
jgi:small subunit ribosomal protein S8